MAAMNNLRNRDGISPQTRSEAFSHATDVRPARQSKILVADGLCSFCKLLSLRERDRTETRLDICRVGESVIHRLLFRLWKRTMVIVELLHSSR